MALASVPELPRRAVIYGRQSRTKEGSESLDIQVDACQRAAEQYGVDVVSTILEPPSTSAFKKRGQARPRFPEVLEAVRSSAVDVVIGYKTDRFSRGGGPGWAPLLEAAESAGLNLDRFVLVPGSGFMSEFEIGIRATMDREESKKTSERLRDMKDRHANEGRPSGGGLRPFGYAKDRFTLLTEDAPSVVDGTYRPEATILREAAQSFLAGESIDSICRRWNTAGILTPLGHEWRGQTLRNILRSGRIAGLRTHRGDVVGPATWDAVIDRATWERIQGKFRARAGRPEPTSRTYLLGAIIRCSKCGERMFPAPVFGTTKYRCEKRPGRHNCGGMTISTEPVDELIAEAVLLRLESPALADRFGAADDDADRAAVEEIQRAETKLAELADMWSVGEITRAEWMAARTGVQSRLDAARARLAKSDRSTALEGLTQLGDDLRARWGELPLSRRQAIVSALIERVVIHPASKRGSRYFEPGRVEPIWRG